MVKRSQDSFVLEDERDHFELPCMDLSLFYIFILYIALDHRANHCTSCSLLNISFVLNASHKQVIVAKNVGTIHNSFFVSF